MVRAMEGGPSVAEMSTHMHYARLVLVSEDAPEFARKLPEKEWAGERDPERIAQMLNESAKGVRDAVKSRVEAGQDMDRHYDHPILMLQHLIWHEGYHHGQIKLALKLAGRPISDKVKVGSRLRSERRLAAGWFAPVNLETIRVQDTQQCPPFAKTKPQRVGHPGKNNVGIIRCVKGRLPAVWFRD